MAITKKLPYPVEWTTTYTGSVLLQTGSTFCGPKSISNACRILGYETIPTEQEVADDIGTSTNYGTPKVNQYHDGIKRWIKTGDYARISLSATTIISALSDGERFNGVLEPPVRRPWVSPAQQDRAWMHIKHTVDSGLPMFCSVQFEPLFYPKAYRHDTVAQITGDASYPVFVQSTYEGRFTHYLSVIGYHEDDSGQRFALMMDSAFYPFIYYWTLEDLCSILTDRGYIYNREGLSLEDQGNDADRLSAEAINAIRRRVDDIEMELGRKLDSDLAGYISEFMRPGHIPIRKKGTGELTSYNLWEGSEKYRVVVSGMIADMIPESAAAVGGTALKAAFEDAVKRIAASVESVGSGGAVDTSQFVQATEVSSLVEADKIPRRKTNGALNSVNNFNGSSKYDCATNGMLAEAFPSAITATTNAAFKTAVEKDIVALVQARFGINPTA